jgi:hypothetical protein
MSSGVAPAGTTEPFAGRASRLCVASREDPKRTLLRLVDVREEVRDLERQLRTRRQELDVLAPAVLVPPPHGRGRRRQGRMNVEVAVVDVDVPAEDVDDEVERTSQVDELDELGIEPDEAE